MTQQNQDNGGRGCIQLLSLFVFIFGALMMYPKTVDLLSKFAPNEFMGYTEMAGWWAAGSALLIEGVLVIWKIKMWIFPARNVMEWAGDAVLTIAPFVLSALAQVFDSMINQDTLVQQPVEIQMAVTWGVPLLPAAMVALLLGYSLIESAPAGLFGINLGGGGKSWDIPNALGNFFKRVGNWRPNIPNAKPNGKQSKPQQPNKNGHKEPEPENPTPGSTSK